jgi:hypothetical protein
LRHWERLKLGGAFRCFPDATREKP